MKQTILLLFLLITTLSFSQITVSGNVTDNNGEPIAGANVIVKGTSKGGVISDFNGNFQISTTSNNTILEFSFLGFENQEVKVDGKSRIDIILIESLESLNEVTIQGFSGVIGKSRKRTENIQTTAESVTALNSEGIESAGITDVSSFSALVPNLKFNSAQAVGLNFITVRGIPQVRGRRCTLSFCYRWCNYSRSKFVKSGVVRFSFSRSR
ncbi:putative outer membrane protein [Algibacter lectus]|uniref:Putative outer membrane protein n=1 Tax=Algibacter lectus TaxID=221126 RepID=A0A090WKZ9_9FLAO|nr:carboxypeptidase-like regulatory domain-containing protein [Algibacter lectus]GAL77745.1 putative outer membrane protein [Algibacter lectus]